MKSKMVTDERILAQKRKISSDAFQLLFYGLLLSILVQQYAFQAKFSQYAVEFVLFIGVSIYVSVRNFMAGNDLFGAAKTAQHNVILRSLVCGGTITVCTALFNNSGAGDAPKTFATLAITFVTATLVAFAMLEIIFIINKRKQRQIQADLNNEENN